MTFESQIAGIPCLIRVTLYSPPSPMRITGEGFGDAIAPEPELFEFEVLDRKGYKAEWLARRLTDEDERRIKYEYLANTRERGT